MKSSDCSADPTIRAAQSSDLEVLLELVRVFHIEEHLAYERETVRRILTDLIADPRLGRLWVMALGSQIVGYALLGHGYSIEYGGRDAFIDEIYLVPEQRKKGYGMRFLNWIRDQARSSGIQVVHLEVDLSNERAFEIYRSFGFKPKDRRMMSLWLEQPGPAAN